MPGHDSALTLADLREQLAYDETTGVFTRKIARSRRQRVGDVAGSMYKDGYVYIRVNTKKYLAHRLAWFYVNGEWPPQWIDHANLDRGDNRICNLRACTPSQNMHNMNAPSHNKSGIKGVCYDNTNRKWLASIQVDGKPKNLGRYPTSELAAAAYEAAAKNYFGEFARG